MAIASLFSSLVKWWHDLIFYVSFSFTLINTFGAGTRWIARTFRLLIFVMVLLFPMMSKLYHYLTNDKVLRQVTYGPNKRNSVDIYLVPSTKMGKDLCPVVCYVGGGGWTVGYRMWALLMEKFFTDQGIVLVSIDYRNFPQGTVSDMLTDINTALSWTIENISRYGGDPENLHVMGQSAGAHLVLLASVDQAARECFVEARKNGMVASSSYGGLSALETEILAQQANPSPPLTNSKNSPKPKLLMSETPPLFTRSAFGRDSPCNVSLNSSLDGIKGLSHRKGMMPLRDVPVGGENGFLAPPSSFSTPSSVDRSKKLALERSLALSKSKPPISWMLKNIRSLMLLSGPFDISPLISHLHDRGLYRQVMYCIMEGELSHNSPCARIQRRSFLECGAAARFPPIYLLHGDVDETIPYQESIKMREVLDEAGANCKLKIFKGKNHTDSVMEDMFTGDNSMLQDVVTCVLKGWQAVEGGKETIEQTKEVEPWRIVIARYVNPF